MDTDLLTKMLTGGSAVTVLGGICAWLLIRTIPAMQAASSSMQESFKQSLQAMADRFGAEMKEQREAWDAHNERLMNWLAAQAGLPSNDPPAKPKE